MTLISHQVETEQFGTTHYGTKIFSHFHLSSCTWTWYPAPKMFNEKWEKSKNNCCVTYVLFIYFAFGLKKRTLLRKKTSIWWISWLEWLNQWSIEAKQIILIHQTNFRCLNAGFGIQHESTRFNKQFWRLNVKNTMMYIE